MAKELKRVLPAVNLPMFPDGYTIFMTDNVTLMTNHLLRQNLSYDAFRDFATSAFSLITIGRGVPADPPSTPFNRTAGSSPIQRPCGTIPWFP